MQPIIGIFSDDFLIQIFIEVAFHVIDDIDVPYKLMYHTNCPFNCVLSSFIYLIFHSCQEQRMVHSWHSTLRIVFKRSMFQPNLTHLHF